MVGARHDRLAGGRSLRPPATQGPPSPEERLRAQRPTGPPRPAGRSRHPAGALPMRLSVGEARLQRVRNARAEGPGDETGVLCV